MDVDQRESRLDVLPPASIVRLAVENDTNLLEIEALSQSSEYGGDFDVKILGAPAIRMPVHMIRISDIDSHFTHTQDLAFWEIGGISSMVLRAVV